MNKSKLLLLFLLLTGVFISCSSDDDDPIIEYEAKMLSFGFHMEDNPGVIFQDYLIETVAGTAINFSMPEEVDKSNLIARFTTTENDKVQVNGVVQESGTTANDFTAPVDYIVSEGTANVKYTVTIGDAPAFVWSALPPFATDQAKSLVMKVNQNDGNPYFLYKQKRETSDEEGAALLTFKDGAWKDLGQASDGRIGTYMDFTFNSAGIPYVSYTDYTTDVNNLLTVKKLSGSTWSLVGDKGFTSSNYSHHSLSFVNDNKILLAGTFDGRTGPLTRRELGVNFFENNSWTLNTTIPGRASDQVGYLIKAVKKGDAVYVGSYNAVTPNTISVYKYSNNTWETLVDSWTDPAATSISLRAFDIAVDNDNNVFVAMSENSTGEEKLRVVKYDSSNKEVESVGNPIIGATGSATRFDLAVSPFGVPYLLFKDESNFPAVVNIDKNTIDWTTPKVLDQAIASELSIDFAADGVAYLSYIKDDVIVAYKYASPE